MELFDGVPLTLVRQEDGKPLTRRNKGPLWIIYPLSDFPELREEEHQQALIAFARTRLAGYKMPRQLVVVEQVQRAANGKSDYKWAKATALAAVAS